MAKQFLIIDGYNLMHAAGLARQRYGPGDLQRQRERFIKSLAQKLNDVQKPLSKVVFDAFESPGNEERKSLYEGMTIEFARAGEDADSLIEKLIRQHSAPKQLLVVSSDHRLQKAARKRKARYIDSETFWNQITSNMNVSEDSGSRNEKPGLSETIDSDLLDRLQDEIDRIIGEE